MDHGDHWECETRCCPGCGTRIFCRYVPDRGLIFWLSEEMDREVDRCPVCTLELSGLQPEDRNAPPEPGSETRRPPGTETRRRKAAGKKEMVNAVLRAGSGEFSSKAASERALDSVGEALVELVAEGTDIRWPGIGTFRIRERKPRRVRNPQTGEMMQVPARKALTFSPAKHLKEKVE